MRAFLSLVWVFNNMYAMLVCMLQHNCVSGHEYIQRAGSGSVPRMRTMGGNEVRDAGSRPDGAEQARYPRSGALLHPPAVRVAVRLLQDGGAIWPSHDGGGKRNFPLPEWRHIGEG